MKRGDSGFSEGSAGNNVATSLASQLPFELLMNVFRRTLSVRDLVVCANVCVNWHSTATTLLWRKPIFASLDSFTRFTRCCSNASLVAPSLRALALEPGEKAEWVVSGERQWLGCLGITRLVFLHFNQVPFLAAFVQPLHIACIAEARPLLSRLDLSNCIQIGDAPLAQIVSVCASSLQHLSLNGCRLVTDAGIAIMSQFCGPFKLLHTLSMRGCGLISDLGISEISKSGLASCLTSFDVSGCYRVTDRGVYRFLDKAVKEASAAQKGEMQNSSL
ncbi:hypothetical protein BC830DRAFT_820963 [Chytriomyces sp. MP71]|nr:hypothetical protein BC830DRAFT_820963 [Chytriomyces sp. MP71]